MPRKKEKTVKNHQAVADEISLEARTEALEEATKGVDAAKPRSVKPKLISTEEAVAAVQALKITDAPSTSKKEINPVAAVPMLDSTFVIPPQHSYLTRSKAKEGNFIFMPPEIVKSSTSEGPRRKIASKSKKKELGEEAGTSEHESVEHTVPEKSSKRDGKDEYSRQGARPKEKPLPQPPKEKPAPKHPKEKPAPQPPKEKPVPQPQKEESAKGKGRTTTKKYAKLTKEKEKEKVETKDATPHESEEAEEEDDAGMNTPTVSADQKLTDSASDSESDATLSMDLSFSE